MSSGGAQGQTPMQRLTIMKDNVLKKVERQMEQYPSLTMRSSLLDMEKKVNVPAPALFILGSSSLVLLLVLLVSMEGVALLVGLAYPLLGALKAIKVQEAHVIKFFIQYFLLFNALNLLETFLPLSRLPLYYLGKLLFLAWAFNPKTQGARLVYGTLRPLLLPHLGIALGASGAEQSRPGGGGRKRGGGRENTGEGRFGARDGSGEGASIHLRIELAARGLEKPAEPERLDTLCQLRILPMTGGHSEVRRAALDEGQWYKSRINTAPPQDAPDWRHDPQFLRVPTTEDNVLEVLIVNKMSWRDHPLGRVRLPLRGLSFPIETTLPLEDPFGDEREGGGEENERGEAQGELEIHLARVEE